MRLVVFFSRGMSLEGWRRAGILDRELALYRALRPQLETLAFVTYGGSSDLVLAAQLPGVDVLPNRWRLSSNLYSVAAPLLHRRALAAATVFKTNQLNGAWSAVIAKRLFHKRLLVRCGFLWSDFVARLHPGNWRASAALRLERQACQSADAVIVAAKADGAAIVERHGLDATRVHVVPNYVDTSSFKPLPAPPRDARRILFVGRLDEQKNLRALIDAVADLPHAVLTIVGDGPLRAQLEEQAAPLAARVTFLGARPHRDLPALLTAAAVFVLPSHYEGHPKALLEAMACGVACVGTRVAGILDVLTHRETGYLCGTSAAEIRAALRDVLDDAALRERMGANAAAYVRAECSLEAAVSKELAVLRSLALSS